MATATQLNSILNKIRTTNLTDAQLNEVQQHLKMKRDILVQSNRTSLMIGSQVQFTSRGRDYTGSITKIARKTATVHSPNFGRGSLVRVPLNMLTAA